MENWILRGDGGASAEKLRAACRESLPPWGYALLCARGLDTPEKLNAFLHPNLEALQMADALPDARAAAEVFAQIRETLGKNARLVVYGDYDVDGVVASVIMKEALETFFSLPDGAVRIYIPDRHEEGYGLNLHAVETLCREADAIVTVDCGITSTLEAERVMRWQETEGERKYLVITDHHTLPETLPKADALVDPLLCERKGLPPCDPLCGAGVALKIAELLCGRAFLESHLDLCALATVADMVPLTGDNRIIVAEGLRRLRALTPKGRPGLYALIRAAGLEDKLSALDAADIGFRIAPRLNAAGRLESAMDSVRLLTEHDPNAAMSVAYALERINAERQEKVKEVRAEAEAQIEKMDLSASFAIVTYGENWESGVVGLAAGKIAEQYGYPTVCLSVQGEKSVGSARSASGINLYAALKTCEDLFERFGGHRQAAGLTLPTKNIPLFASRLSRAVKEQMDAMGKETLCREVVYDLPLTLSDVTLEAVDFLDRMEPFGMGNPSPRFCFENVEAVSLRAVGREQAHLQGAYRQDGAEVKGIYFGMGVHADLTGKRVSLIAALYRNAFRGRESCEMRLDALRAEADEPAAEKKSGIPPSDSAGEDDLLAACLSVAEVGRAVREQKAALVLLDARDIGTVLQRWPMLRVFTAREALSLSPEAFSGMQFILAAGEGDPETEKRLSALFAGRTLLRV